MAQALAILVVMGGLTVVAILAVRTFVLLFHDAPAHRELRSSGAFFKGRLWKSQTLATFCALCMVAGFAYLALAGLELGPGGLIVGAFVACLPVPIHAAIIYWLDRMEPEPPILVFGAFLWGATCAVFLAYVFNDLTGFIITHATGLKSATTVLVAPVVEETAKGLAVLTLFLARRADFDDIVDGIVYAAMVALGFAMSENVLYFGRALSHGGGSEIAKSFILRGVISPYCHPLFTSMTGIGIGVAAQSGRGPLKFIAPFLGYCAAIMLHGVWNFSADYPAAFAGVYFLLMAPALLMVLFVLVLSWQREQRLLCKELEPECRNGSLSREEYEEVSSVWLRLKRDLASLLRLNIREWLKRRRFHLVAAELGFYRYRIEQSGKPPGPSQMEREAAYRALLETLRPTPPRLREPPPVIR